MPTSTAGSEKEGYLLEMLSTKEVYLTIYTSSINESVFRDIKLLCAILQKNDIKNYKVADLIRIINSHDGTRTQIVGTNKDIAEKVDNVLPIVDVSKDKMRAEISFSGKAEEFVYDKDFLMKLIADKGITFGIDDSSIEAFLMNPLITQTIANGRMAINGENAYIKKHIDFTRKGRPTVDDYGKVDYKDMNMFFLVSKGDVLAERVPQTKGENGMNVLGQSIVCRAGKPILFNKGKNTELLDENTLIASIDGQAVEERKGVSVNPMLEINSDVDVATGNIHFNGSVFVKGSVQDGYTIEAEGDVNVGGTVSGGFIEAKNIFIEGGVLGMRRGKISAREDIRTTFIENADVTAGHNIYITDAALHSRINAGNKIIIKGKHGQIVGGHASAGLLIESTVLGNPMSVVTSVEVGVDPIIKEKHVKLAKKIKSDEKQLKNVRNALVISERIAENGKLSATQKEKIDKLKRMQFPLIGHLERELVEMKGLSNQVKSMSNAKIRVDDKVYSGVNIIVTNYRYTVQTELQHCTFSMDSEKQAVKLGPY